MDAATTKYGPIACWNTSTVTDTIFLIIIIWQHLLTIWPTGTQVRLQTCGTCL
jgi:hypothetical protein